MKGNRYKYLVLRILKVMLLFGVLLLSLPSWGQLKTLKIDEDFKTKLPINLVESCVFYQSAEDLSAEQVLSKIADNKMPLAKQKASQGFSDNFFWVYFELASIDTTKHNLALKIDNPHIDYLELFEINTKGVKTVGVGGDKLTFNQRTFENRAFVFPINIKNTTKKYLLKVDKRKASVSIPLQLWQLKALKKFESKSTVFYGIFFGVIGLVAILSLLVGLYTKQKPFIYYGVYVGVLWFYIFTALGFSFQFLYPDSSVLNNYTRSVLALFLSVSSIQFAIEFLSLKEKNRLFFKLLTGIKWLLLLLFALWLLFPSFYSKNITVVLNILYALFFASFIIQITASIKALNYDKAQALLFILAFVNIGLASIVYLFIEYGLIDETLFKISPFVYGVLVEILVLSLAMVYRFKKILNYKDMLSKAVSEVASVYQMPNRDDREVDNESDGNGKTPDFNEVIVENKIIKENMLAFKSHYIIDCNEIVYCAVSDRYVQFFIVDKEHPDNVRISLKEVLDKLPNNQFVRVHRAFVVNIHAVVKVNATSLSLSNGSEIPISRTYKPKIVEMLGE